MANSNGQRRRPTTGARIARPVMVVNIAAADGFFRPDAPKPGQKGPDRGSIGGFIEVYA